MERLRQGARKQCLFKADRSLSRRKPLGTDSTYHTWVGAGNRLNPNFSSPAPPSSWRNKSRAIFLGPAGLGQGAFWMNRDARPTTASPTVSPAVPDWSVATSLLNASNCVFVKPKGAHRVDAGLNYGLSLNDFARGALVGCGARSARKLARCGPSVNGRPHYPLHRRDAGGAQNALAGAGPPSHWRSLIFCRIVAVGQTKRCLNPELSVCFRPIETTHPVWAERRRRWERMKARAEALKHSADNPRGRFGEGENFW